MPTCPYCAEEIAAGTRVCPHCHSNVTFPPPPPVRSLPPRPVKSGMSGWMIFLVVGAVVFIIAVPILIMIALLLPAVQQAREAARQAACRNNLREIGLALHNYHEVHGTFPPAYIPDKTGRPMHSWRVLILPFLDGDANNVYRMYDFSKPWDAPENQLALESMPSVYRCPSEGDEATNTTSYLAATGPNCVFRGSEPVRIQDITDGISNTLLIGEAAGLNFPWTMPEDVNVDLVFMLNDPAGFSSEHPNGCNFLFVEGSVRLLNNSTSPDVLKAYSTINGSEPVPGLDGF